MDLMILDSSFRSSAVIDVFKSIIWTDRYSKFGDFELYLSLSASSARALFKKRYIASGDSEHVMFINKMDTVTNDDGSRYVSVIGRSLESILDRRIVWDPTILKVGFQEGIKRLILENIISPTDPERAISNFIFEDSTDPYILSLTLDVTCYGENLYDLISTWCQAYSVGFKITLTEDGKFKFQLYYGLDRSYAQTALPYVVFSETNGDLSVSNVVESDENEKTIALVVGPDDGTNPIKILSVTSSEDSPTGLDRKEIFADASSVSQTVDGVTLTDPEHYAQLAQQGFDVLYENSEILSFDASLKENKQYDYNSKYYMGDIVQFQDDQGLELRVRIVEFIMTRGEDNKGYPTFEKVV